MHYFFVKFVVLGPSQIHTRSHHEKIIMFQQLGKTLSSLIQANIVNVMIHLSTGSQIMVKNDFFINKVLIKGV